MAHDFDGLASQGYMVFFNPRNLDDLIRECQGLDIHPAGIGNGLLNDTIRRDKTCWLSMDQGPAIKAYLDDAELLRRSLNETLFLNLDGFECHYAIFEKGSFYKKHIDNISGQSNRIITYILYLNEKWQKADGGELSLTNGICVEPSMGHSILFLSSEISHEVLESHTSRMSISGWFTRKP